MQLKPCGHRYIFDGFFHNAHDLNGHHCLGPVKVMGTTALVQTCKPMALSRSAMLPPCSYHVLAWQRMTKRLRSRFVKIQLNCQHMHPAAFIVML